MVRTRRGMSAQGEPEATGDSGAQWERDFTAALSQADPEMKPQGTEKVLAAGEASPNTLEQGGAGQPQLPTASPFHSTKVKEEVELLRCRPAGLDLEQARVEAGVVSASGRDQLEPLEPNYAAAFENSMEAGPRIARVEAEYGLPGPFGNSSTDPVVAGLGFSTVVNEPAKGDQGDPQPANLGQGPSEEDGRELIPDRSLSSQAEFLLAQVMEENRALRKRLEQVELHSHSSWHSGVPGEGGVTMSPVSFTEGGQGKAGGKGKVKAKAGAQAKGITEETASASVASAAKAGAQAKGITEETASASVASASAVSGSTSATPSPEALVAEAAKLLKGVALKPLRVEVDESWIRSALASASNPDYCLIDSGKAGAQAKGITEETASASVASASAVSGSTLMSLGYVVPSQAPLILIIASWIAEQPMRYDLLRRKN
eukprot:s742_g5.t1